MATASLSTSLQHGGLRCHLPPRQHSGLPSSSIGRNFSFSTLPSYSKLYSSFLPHPNLLTCRSTSTTEPPPQEELLASPSGGQRPPDDEDSDDGDGDGGGAMGRVYSALIFAIWAGFIGYCAFLSPNFTPVSDQYFLEKLLNLKGDDGFQMNQVLFCLWNIMGLWPAIYWMLLIPTGRRCIMINHA